MQDRRSVPFRRIERTCENSEKVRKRNFQQISSNKHFQEIDARLDILHHTHIHKIKRVIYQKPKSVPLPAHHVCHNAVALCVVTRVVIKVPPFLVPQTLSVRSLPSLKDTFVFVRPFREAWEEKEERKVKRRVSSFFLTSEVKIYSQNLSPFSLSPFLKPISSPPSLSSPPLTQYSTHRRGGIQRRQPQATAVGTRAKSTPCIVRLIWKTLILNQAVVVVVKTRNL